ncbi:MAG: hypothetical protein ACE5IG_02925 [Dehalococcoidia bacterium]
MVDERAQTEMKNVPARFLAWSLWAFSIGLVAVILLVEYVLVPSLGQYMLAERVAHAVAITAIATVGAVVASRHPEYLIGWLVLLFPVIGVTAEGLLTYAQYAVHVRSGELPGGALVWLFANAIWVVAYTLLLFVVLLFPRGTLLSPRWRWVVWGAVGAFAALIVAFFLSPSPDVDPPLPPTVTNPLAIAGAGPVLDAVEAIAGIAFLILWGSASVSIVLRFTRSNGDERQQIKWFAYTAAIFGAFMIAIIAFDWSGQELPAPWGEFLFVGFLLLPFLGIATAILKYRLYDIDLIINRTFVYVPLTGLLGGLYIGGIQFSRLIFAEFTGTTSDAVIIITVFIVASLFTPLRSSLQAFVDRTFKELGDPVREVGKFRQELRPILQVFDSLEITRRFLDESIRAYQAKSGIIRLHRSNADETLHAVGGGAPAISIPIVYGDRTMGELALGPRADGRPYSDADRAALLECAADVGRAVLLSDISSFSARKRSPRGSRRQTGGSTGPRASSGSNLAAQEGEPL